MAAVVPDVSNDNKTTVSNETGDSTESTGSTSIKKKCIKCTNDT